MILPPVEDLPEGWVALDVAAVVKCWDKQGQVRFLPRYSGGLNDAEKRGMADLASEWLADDEVAAHFGMGQEVEDEDDD